MNMTRSLACALFLATIPLCFSSDAERLSLDWGSGPAVTAEIRMGTVGEVGGQRVAPSDTGDPGQRSVDPDMVWTPDTTTKGEMRTVPIPDHVDSNMVRRPDATGGRMSILADSSDSD